MAKLGWIGIGDIGMPMMVRLKEAGHDVSVWGRNKTRVAEAERAGAKIAGSAAELARANEAVFLCVTDTVDVEEVVFGPNGIATTSRAGTLIVDHSTTHPTRTREIAQKMRADGKGRWVDAPVSGGSMGARAGTLAVMVGGEAQDVEAVRPWLSAYGGKITHIGGSGAGQASKACNQAIANATIMVWAEMIAYARSFGLDLDKFVEATEGGFADSLVRRVHVPNIASGAYPGHYVSVIPKQLDIVCDVARVLQTPIPLTSMVTSLYRQHQMLQARSATQVGIVDLFQKPRKDAES
jgi:3-hydroxyisobutyrate dehydrogenase